MATPRLATFWVLGLIFGFVVQRSRFCFVSAISNFALFGDNRLVKGILIGLLISTIGFSAIMLPGGSSTIIPSGAHVSPFGWHLVLAGLLFGFGMMLAGGCLLSTLYRLGEGALSSFVVLFGVLFGMSIFQLTSNPWNKYILERVPFWMPQHFGWILSIIITTTVITLLILIVFIKSPRIKRIATEKKRFSDELKQAPKAVFVNAWSLTLGGILFGLFNILMFAVVQRPFGITGELMRWANIIMGALRIPTPPLGGIPGT